MIRLSLFFFTLLYASIAQSEGALSQKLSDYLNKASPPDTSHSISVLQISDGAAIFEDHSDELMIPASTSKLLISGVALTKWSPDFTFQTLLYRTGSISRGVVKGDLIVEGGGDPMITTENLWRIAADLSLIGIKVFKGDLLLDNSRFDALLRDTVDREAAKKSSSHAYDAPVTAFGVSFNTFPIAIAPGDANGQKALVNVDPYPLDPLISVSNQVKTVAQIKKSEELLVSRVERDSKPGQDSQSVVLAKGQVLLGSSLRKVYRSSSDPVLSSGAILRSFLKAFGIEVQGQIKELSPGYNKKKTLLFVQDSQPLSLIIRSLNLYSNNYIADVLLKNLGFHFQKEGSFLGGLAVLNESLRKDFGLRGDFQIANASGLSPKNRLSARHFTSLLNAVSKDFKIFPEFLNSLSVSGKTGSLEKLFDRSPYDLLKGLVRAKTGTLSDPVTSCTLAGYLQHPRYGLLAFALLENGKNGFKTQPDQASLRKFQEGFLLELYRN
ncbi:MAG: D-alanyl-D-alanine carboxypeptidase/D-alanyl-D-alanine-endopeptidase [Oligoflexales bacterium]|nr:D-alanyl-D-alanine carboxypeptidase/D-alanyl-D-alanine-endopeptidase [Oligoflexales bacterium]